jgi:predicted RNase H-like HicB family nuclease
MSYAPRRLEEMTKRKTYTARFELATAGGKWVVVANVGRHLRAISDGQTLPKARKRIRQAIALLLDVEDEHSFDIEEQVQLPPTAMARIGRHRGARDGLRKQEAEASRAARAAARALTALGISRRDTGDLLGLTGARIQQVLKS